MYIFIVIFKKFPAIALSGKDDTSGKRGAKQRKHDLLLREDESGIWLEIFLGNKSQSKSAE